MDEITLNHVRAFVAAPAAPAAAPRGAPATAPPQTGRPSPPAAEAALESAARQLQAMAVQHEVNLNFTVHKATGRTMIKVTDAVTKEVVREIPPEEVLDVVATMEKISGKLVSTRA
ncbi:MAG: flagellar protein FlaG [Thermodesulfobacteriota bacterium]